MTDLIVIMIIACCCYQPAGKTRLETLPGGECWSGIKDISPSFRSNKPEGQTPPTRLAQMVVMRSLDGNPGISSCFYIRWLLGMIVKIGQPQGLFVKNLMLFVCIASDQTLSIKPSANMRYHNTHTVFSVLHWTTSVNGLIQIFQYQAVTVKTNSKH